MTNSKSRIVGQCTIQIGAANGKPTEFVCYELDASTPVLHAYPVSETEADKIRGEHSIVRINDL